MKELHFPWLELSILVPLLGALVTGAIRHKRADLARVWALWSTGITLAFSVAAWRDFNLLKTFEAHDRWDLLRGLRGADVLVIDELSAPLLPLTSLLYFLTVLSTLRTKVRRLSFNTLLFSQAILLLTLSSKEPTVVIGLLFLSTLPPVVELISRRKPIRAYTIHLSLHVLFLTVGWGLFWAGSSDSDSSLSNLSLSGVVLMMLGILIRCGVAPLHCWMTDLFEHASFGSALLFVTPMAGAYGALRLILPIAPDWTMRILAVASLLTALYASGMALVQTESRRYFCYLFLSNSSLVLVGLETATPAALTGGLCVWLSVSLSLAGLGFTLRSIESRMGRLSLRDFHGLYEHTPTLAWLFLLTGLASVGFPGTIGFIANELLVDGLIHQVPLFGVVVVLVAAINGISILQVYFRLFTGKRHSSSISLKIQLPEQVAVLVLAAVVLGAGLVPQPFLSSRFHAANQLMERRKPDSETNDSNDPELDQRPFHSPIGSTK